MKDYVEESLLAGREHAASLVYLDHTEESARSVAAPTSCMLVLAGSPDIPWASHDGGVSRLSDAMTERHRRPWPPASFTAVRIDNQ